MEESIFASIPKIENAKELFWVQLAKNIQRMRKMSYLIIIW